MRFLSLVVVLVLVVGCMNVYVQTGSGSIERSIDFERSGRMGRLTTVEAPQQEQKNEQVDKR